LQTIVKSKEDGDITIQLIALLELQLGQPKEAVQEMKSM
jgi:hypothetical protein